MMYNIGAQLLLLQPYELFHYCETIFILAVARVVQTKTSRQSWNRKRPQIKAGIPNRQNNIPEISKLVVYQLVCPN